MSDTVQIVCGVLFFGVVFFFLFRIAKNYDEAKNIEVGHYEKQGEVWVVDYTLTRNGKVVSKERREVDVIRDGRGVVKTVRPKLGKEWDW